MPRGVRALVPENEARVTELGLVGRANRQTGKTEWIVEQQSVGETSGKVYDSVILMKDVEQKDGSVKNVPVSGAKQYCQGFLDGYNFRQSELEEGE